MLEAIVATLSPYLRDVYVNSKLLLIGTLIYIKIKRRYFSMNPRSSPEMQLQNSLNHSLQVGQCYTPSDINFNLERIYFL